MDEQKRNDGSCLDIMIASLIMGIWVLIMLDIIREIGESLGRKNKGDV